MIASPTVSKVKRNTTTMEAFGSGDKIVGAETTKILRTYGRKGLKDSLGLAVEGNEDLDLSEPRKAKKRRAGSGSSEMLGFSESSAQKKLKRRATTHLENPTSGLGAEGTGSLNDFKLFDQEDLHHQISNTVLNTSLEPLKSSGLTRPNQSSSLGSMKAPNISTRSPDGTAIASLDPDEQDPLAAPISASSTQQVPPAVAFERKTTLEVVIDARTNPRSSTACNHDVTLPNCQPPLSPPTKSKSKRKLTESFHLNDFGSDDAIVGLPAEQYQPRPSRSRANRTVDDLIMNIDYSKRPEAILKKAKRRKTTGFIVDREEVAEETFRDFKADSKVEDKPTSQAVKEHVDFLECASFPFAIDQVADGPILLQDDEPLPMDMNPPKKKRGRPKKQATKDDVDMPISVDIEVDVPAHPTSAAAKEPRKRRKTAEEMILEEDEPEKLSAIHQPVRNQEDAALEENEDAANVVKEPPVEDLQPFIKETTPAPVKPAGAAETPQDKGAKVTPKRSPLNSNKVPVRVGLSKRASIQPLLRMVRK